MNGVPDIAEMLDDVEKLNLALIEICNERDPNNYTHYEELVVSNLLSVIRMARTASYMIKR